MQLPHNLHLNYFTILLLHLIHRYHLPPLSSLLHFYYHFIDHLFFKVHFISHLPLIIILSYLNSSQFPQIQLTHSSIYLL